MLNRLVYEQVIFRPKKEDPLLKTPEHGELRDLLETIRRTHDSTLPPPPGWKPNSKTHKHPSQYVQEPMQRFYRTRDLAIVEGLISSGLRSGELLSVKLEDYEPRFRMEIEGATYIVPRLLVRKSKNDEPLVVYMTPEWARTVRMWLDARKEKFEFKRTADTLFIGRDGRSVGSSWWTHQFGRYLALACQRGYRTHDIRHRVGEDVTRQKGIYAAKEKLNHRDIRSTLIYSKRNEADMVKIALEVDSLSQVKRAHRK